MKLGCRLQAESPSFNKVLFPLFSLCRLVAVLWLKNQGVIRSQLPGEPPCVLTLSWVLPALCSAPSRWLVWPTVSPGHFKDQQTPSPQWPSFIILTSSYQILCYLELRWLWMTCMWPMPYKESASYSDKKDANAEETPLLRFHRSELSCYSGF